jgi:CheY-like chemotaxis protein
LQRTPAAFDVVLSDVVMPGTLNGIGLAQRLRESRPDLPVVLMTGYAEELGKAASLQVEVLPKPCSAEAIIAAVQRARATVQAPSRTAAI